MESHVRSFFSDSRNRSNARGNTGTHSNTTLHYSCFRTQLQPHLLSNYLIPRQSREREERERGGSIFLVFPSTRKKFNCEKPTPKTICLQFVKYSAFFVGSEDASD